MGEAEELQHLLAPVYELSPPQAASVEKLPYWEAQDLLAETGARKLTQTRSRYIYSELPIEASDLALDRLGRWPGSGGSAVWKVHLVGGAVDKVSRRGTAYVHRGAKMLSSIELSWKSTDPEPRLAANLAWLDEFHLSMEPFTSSESYQNFSDPSQDNFAHAYYAENLTYLSSLKRRLDPDRSFDFAQAVPAHTEA